MIDHPARYLLLLLTAMLALAGCSSNGEAPTRYYIIEAVAPTSDASSGLAVAIEDLDIPQYLERFQIASRRTESQLAFATSHQWAENLRKNLGRTLSRNLANLLGTADVGSPASRSNSKPDVRVNLSIERFERDADGYVQLVARWQVIDASGSVQTHSSTLTGTSRVAAKDYAGTVTQMSDLFGDLSSEIASVIRAMEQTD